AVNTNFCNATAYQLPFSARIGAKLSFEEGKQGSRARRAEKGRRYPRPASPSLVRGRAHLTASAPVPNSARRRSDMKKALAFLAASGLLISFPAAAVDPPQTAKSQRFAPLTFEQLTVYQKPLGEQILKVSSVGLGGPYNPLLRSPVLGQRMFDLLYYLRWNSSLPLRLNEMAILITGRLWRSQVEWYAH